jgi:hypothetical protein
MQTICKYGFTLSHNAHAPFFGASTIKTLVALFAYMEIYAERLCLDDRISNRRVGDMLAAMLYTSENQPFHILRDYFGVKALNGFAADLGLSSFRLNINENQWAMATAYCAARLWLAVYDFAHASDLGNLFLTQLKTARWNIVQTALPQRAVPFKYGLTDNIYAVNSIIMKDGGTSFIFTFYTTGSFADNIIPELVTTLDKIVREFDIMQ